ncbi:hypothetical protein B9Z19DRAFT_1065251 [Tuber borchii]|uniref:Glycine zipper domain-containing protein n=1 Tax=Tuber borchii TaxID=42251 RepID=A0A2T6ZRW4_TUBBO|nr:hypothetical protein B9Z19DRAFT_1065251 [Tuber borchii]
MFSFFKRLKDGLSQGFQRLRTVCQNSPVNPIWALKASVKAAGPLRVVSRSSRAIVPVTLTLSAIQILLAENKMDQFANEVCTLALGAAGAAIGSSIGVVGGLPGMIIGAGVGSFLGGILGDWVHGKIKEWLFTEGKDGVRPIDKIADKFRAATDTLRVVSEVIAIVMRGQAEVFAALLQHWRRTGGLGGGPGVEAV